jgi:hypothetical protein
VKTRLIPPALQSVRRIQVIRQQIALDIDVPIGAVCDLAGGFAELDANVKDRRPRPERPPIGTWQIRLPEPHMMSLPWAVSDRLFKGQILHAIRNDERRVTSSAGNQPAATNARSISSSVPTMPRLRGSPGMREWVSACRGNASIAT